MIDLKQIESFYPEHLRQFKRNLLREYLQYKILENIFDSAWADKLAFMGGTAIHIIHGNTRFSEYLDFDNRGLKKDEFVALVASVEKSLRLQGYEVESRNVFKTAYHSRIKFFRVLFENNISSHQDEVLTIQIDLEPQSFTYNPDKIILNKFDVFLMINVVPVDVLLAQKIACLFTRKRPMGRDFFDIVFLSGRTEPNLTYLKEKLCINSRTELRRQLLKECKKFNFKQLAEDVRPFLFSSAEAKKILFFKDYVEKVF